jgi:FdhD protein
MLQPARTVQNLRVHRYTGDGVRRVRDAVSVEEPLEIRIAFPEEPRGPIRSSSVAVTMRTPGHDFELAAGFLVTEGVLRDRAQLHELTYCRPTSDPQQYNVVEARLHSGEGVDLERLSRNVFTSSSCGVCGKASLEAVEVLGCTPLPDGSLAVSPERVRELPELLRAAQPDFSRTGGLHAAGLAGARGEMGHVREDVGRHNAVDKVIGTRFLAGRLPLGEEILVVSGRVSFEVVQKAVMAGIPMIVAVGAPSSLAIDLANRFRVTLAGFVRDGSFNVYATPGRIG